MKSIDAPTPNASGTCAMRLFYLDQFRPREREREDHRRMYRVSWIHAYLPIIGNACVRVSVTLVRTQNGDVKITVGNFESELEDQPDRAEIVASLFFSSDRRISLRRLRFDAREAISSTARVRRSSNACNANTFLSRESRDNHLALAKWYYKGSERHRRQP